MLVLENASGLEERDLVFTYMLAGMLDVEQHADNKASSSCKPNKLGATTLAATKPRVRLYEHTSTRAHVTAPRSATAYSS